MVDFNGVSVSKKQAISLRKFQVYLETLDKKEKKGLLFVFMVFAGPDLTSSVYDDYIRYNEKDLSE